MVLMLLAICVLLKHWCFCFRGMVVLELKFNNFSTVFLVSVLQNWSLNSLNNTLFEKARKKLFLILKWPLKFNL